jgi:hypothetical protein
MVVTAGWQNWAIFRLLGVCLCRYVKILAKKGWATFWAIFHKIIWSPRSPSYDRELQRPALKKFTTPWVAWCVLNIKNIFFYF